jgi:hypothetical protein
MILSTRWTYRHKNGGLYRIKFFCAIKIRNWFFKRVWERGVVYTSLKDNKLYVRTAKDFSKRFTNHKEIY